MYEVYLKWIQPQLEKNIENYCISHITNSNVFAIAFFFATTYWIEGTFLSFVQQPPAPPLSDPDMKHARWI